MWSHYHIVVIVIFIDVHFIIATYISYALASKSSQINFSSNQLLVPSFDDDGATESAGGAELDFVVPVFP